MERLIKIQVVHTVSRRFLDQSQVKTLTLDGIGHDLKDPCLGQALAIRFVLSSQQIHA